MRSAVYDGIVVHQRHRPRAHSLRYRVFSLLLDLDELAELDRTLKLFAHNRMGVYSFHNKDHGTLAGEDVKLWVAGHLKEAGVEIAEPRVEILAYPRIFGYVFNPVSVFYCRDGNGDLRAILYEVCNTYYERHTYVFPVDGEGVVRRHSGKKQFFVSPFMGMNCQYHFRVEPPDERVAVAINQTDADGALLYAAFHGRRRPLTDTTLAKMFASHPLMTLKVTAAIHWEAVRLWWKGIPIHHHTKATRRVDASYIRPSRNASPGFSAAALPVSPETIASSKTARVSEP